MVHALSIGDNKEIYVTESWEDIQRIHRRKEKLLWIDLLKPTAEDLTKLSQIFGFDELSIRNLSEYTKGSTVNIIDDYLFMTTHVWYEQEEAIPEINIIISEAVMITIYYQEITEIGSYWKSIMHRKYEGPITVDIMLYNLLDGGIDTFQTTIEEVETQLEDLEELVILDKLEGKLLEITQLRRKLIYFRRQLISEINMIDKLLHPDLEYFSDKSRAYFRDIKERFERVLRFSEVNKELVGSLFDTYLSVQSNRANITSAKLNMVMQRLTAITAIFLPLTLIVGIYGMNFMYMPELQWRYGYFSVMVLMLILGAGLFYYVKRKGWLD